MSAGLAIGLDGSACAQGAGVGRYTRGLLRALLDQSSDDSHTIVLPRGLALPEDLSKLQGHSRAVQLPVNQRLATIAWHRLHLSLPIEWFTGRLDLFHAPDFVMPPLKRAQGIVTVHDLSYLRLPQCAEPRLTRYLSDAVPRSLKRAAMVLADSDHTAGDITELLGVPPGRIRTVYPGVDWRFSPTAEQGEVETIRSAIGGERPYVLCVGTIEPRKNYPAAIAGFTAMCEREGADLDLVIAGGVGWLAEEPLAAIAAGGDRVRHVGRVPDELLPALYRQAWALLYPSHYEGFGLPPVEAMACGTPVVASRTSSLPEACGDAAVYCDTSVESIAAALSRLYRDEGLQTRCRELGLAQAARFTWEEAAQQVRSIYHELV